MAARCPVCAGTFDDVDAVRRHTLVEHGLEPEATPGPWTSVSSPGPAGWYPDPWNASALRWWDGAGWSARMAPVGSAPPEPEPAGKRRRPPASQLVVAGAIALAVIVIAVVVVSGSGHKARRVAAPATTLVPVPTTAAPAVGLVEGVLSASDIGGGWSAASPAQSMTADQFSSGPCNSPLWKADVAGYSATFKDGGGSAVSSAEVRSYIYEASSEGAAQSISGYVTSSSWVPCLETEADLELNALFANSDIGVSQLSADPLNLNVPVTSVGYVVSADIVNQTTGESATVSVDDIQMFLGRYIAVVDIASSTAAPVPIDTLIPQLTAAAVHRMQELPAGGTAGQRSV